MLQYYLLKSVLEIWKKRDMQTNMKKNLHFFSTLYKNGKNIIFDDEKINKSTFYKNKKIFNIYDIDLNEILVSKNNLMVRKSSLTYIIGYNDYNIIRPLCIKLPQMIAYVKCFDISNTMCFKVTENRLLKKYTKYGT